MSEDGRLALISQSLKEAEIAKVSTSKKAGTLTEVAKEWVRAKLRESWVFGGTEPKFIVNKGDSEGPIYKVSKEQALSIANEAEIKAELYQKYMTATPNEINEVFKLIKYELYQYSLDIKSVPAIGLKDGVGPVWTRLPFSENEVKDLSLEELPEFEHFLNLCGNGARSVVLWIGSLLDPHSSRTQYLHMQSNGGNGKSTLLEAITLVLGNDRVLSVDSSTFNDNYFGESLEGARILLFADENNTSFFSTGKFKRFTGEDGISVNPKYKATRYIKFTHKTVVLSNNEVQITSSAADVRRLISVTMANDTETGGHRWWYKGLKNSGEKILGYCYAQYLKALEQDESIRAFIPVDQKLIDSAIKRKYEEVLGVFFERYKITTNEADRVRCSVMHSEICKELGIRRSPVTIASIKEALATVGVGYNTSNNLHSYTFLKPITQIKTHRV